MIAAGVVASSTIGRGFYGSLAMDGLANLRVGDTFGYACSLRFQALRTGVVDGFRTIWVGYPVKPRPGYSDGTGGVVRITAETDDAGEPSGDVIAEAEVSGPTSGMPYYAFDDPMPVTAGQTYHIVCRNIDADPVANFSSVDCVWVDTVTSYQTRPGSGELTALFTYTSGPWAVAPNHRPVLDLSYGDGSHQGQGYMEAEVGSTVSGNSMARERFTVTGGSRIVTGAAVRLAKVSGSDNVLVRLEDNTGTLIDSFSASIAAVPTLTDPAGDAGGSWVSGSFASARLLTSGQEYRLRVSVAGTTSLWTRGIEQGQGYDFDPVTYFADGVLEISTDGGSTWGYVSGLGSWGDLQFYFI